MPVKGTEPPAGVVGKEPARGGGRGRGGGAGRGDARCLYTRSILKFGPQLRHTGSRVFF